VRWCGEQRALGRPVMCGRSAVCSGVAVAWRSVGVQCGAEQLASVLGKSEVGEVRVREREKEKKKKKGRWQDPRQAGEGEGEGEGEVRAGRCGCGCVVDEDDCVKQGPRQQG